MKKLSMFFAGLLLSAGLYAQKIIAVHHSSGDTFFTDLQTAIESAPDGATVHLPGGHFSLPGNFNIDKKIHLIGVGHHPDSTLATEPTFIDGNLHIGLGMTGGSIIGMYISNEIQAEHTQGDFASNVLVKRCNMHNIRIDGISSQNSAVLWHVDECVIRIGTTAFSGSEYENCLFSNNVVYGAISNAIKPGCTFSNNIFLKEDDVLRLKGGVTFIRNVFLDTMMNERLNVSGSGEIENIFFSENIFVDDLDDFPILTNTGQNNIDGVGSEVFVDASNANYYDNNYHIRPSIGGAFDGDGNEIKGLYDIEKPFKEGSLPSNPHISVKQVNTTTDASGKLKVLIEVTSQGN